MINKKKNTYVQPACQVFQVKVESIIATSPNASNEEYVTGDTSSWFNAF